MIVSGYFVDIDCKKGIKARFVTDKNVSLYVQTNIEKVSRLISTREYYIQDVLFLLKLKEIDGLTVSESPMRWYILDAMVFGD